MFRGVTHLNLDAKGRMAFPSRYRDRLEILCGGELVVTIDHENPCLMVYPLSRWVEVEQRLSETGANRPQVRRLRRLLIGHAHELEVDNNGRVLLPSVLREYAGLEKKVVLVGQVHRFELWDADNWQEATEAWLREAREEDMDDLGDLVL